MGSMLKVGMVLYHLHGENNNDITQVTITKIDYNPNGIYVYANDEEGKQYRFILINYSIGKTHFGKEVFINMEDLINRNTDDDNFKTEITECKSFNCENYKDGKCMLKKVRIVVVENELECEDATN